MSLEFIGGLVTGEGCFALGVGTGWKGAQRITPIFQIKMNDFVTMERLNVSLQHHGLPTYVMTGQRTEYGENVPWMRIRASGMKRVLKYANTLIPHITGTKLDAAQIMVEFIESRLSDERSDKHGRPYSVYELGLVQKLRDTNGNRNGKKNSLEPSETARLGAYQRWAQDTVRSA